MVLDPGDDIVLCSGDQTDEWDLYYVGNTNRAPAVDLGEHELGWYYLDLDGDHIAEGSDPLNWDTDGDWLVDWFEVKDDEEDGFDPMDPSSYSDAPRGKIKNIGLFL